MSAFKADYRYRCGFKEIGTTEVDIEDIKLVDTEELQYGDLLCIYAMNYSEHELSCIKLRDCNICTINTSDCVLHSICYPLRKGTRVVTSMVSECTKRGKTGFILKTDYRTYLPYCVKWDDDSTSWVIGCTITPEESMR